MRSAASACRNPLLATSSGRRASISTQRRGMILPLRSLATSVDFGGELQEVVESLAQSDDILRHFTMDVDDDATNRTRAKQLGQIMQVKLVTASPDTRLEEAEKRLKGIQGLPVVDEDGKLVGVLSHKDLSKGGSLVKDVMSSKPVALKATDCVSAAAHAMIDNKISRIPVVDECGHCIGIVTRTDVFWSMCSDSERNLWFGEHGVGI